MRLSYRGVHYEQPFSPLEVREGEIRGKYRGQDWQYHYPSHIPQLQAKSYRQYRGVNYGDDLMSVGETFRIPSVFTNNVCSVPIQKPAKIVTNEATQVHLDNIRTKLERRLQIAREKGDTDLVNLLKKESQELSLNI